MVQKKDCELGYVWWPGDCQEFDSGIDFVHGCLLEALERQFHLLLRAVRSKAVNQLANEFLG